MDSEYGEKDFRELDIIDPEVNPYGSSAEGFNYDSKVSMAYDACIKAGCQEMKKGYLQSKSDKYGNVLTEWKEDTRKTYIECVRTLKSVLISHLDAVSKKNIVDLEGRDIKLKQEAIQNEESWYNSLPMSQRIKISHSRGYLNQDMFFYHDYMDDKLDVYRKIFEELELLLARLKYLKKQALSL